MIYIPGVNRLYGGVLLRYFMKFDHVGKHFIASPSCDIRREATPYIHLGDNVFLDRDVWLNIPYEAPPPVKNHPVIKICDGTVIGRRCTISSANRIEIGEKCLFGPSVFITDHSHEFGNPSMPIMDQGITEGGSIIIEEGCWFGHNSAVVTHRGREIRIGRHSIIGANAVVTRNFPEYSILVGNPTRNVGKVTRTMHKKTSEPGG